METRSSPSLQVLQGLARHAHMEPENLSTLSKPALFGHLRSNYDFTRLERAHQIALKRSGASASTSPPDTTTSNSNNGSSINSSDSLTPPSKRPCRTTSSGGSSSSSRSNGMAAAAGSAGFELQQGLPPASIFVQTRSRSRLLAAASGSTSTGSINAQSLLTPPALAASNTTSSISLPAERPVRAAIVTPGGGSGNARAMRSSSRSSSPRPRTGGRRGSSLKLSRGADESQAVKAARRGSSSGSGSDGDTPTGTGERGRAGSGSTAAGGSSSACATGGEGAGIEVYEATGSANTAKRKRLGSGSGSGSGGASKSPRKGKGKSKAKASSGRSEGGASSCKAKGKGKGQRRGACNGGGDAQVTKGSRENVANGSGDCGKDGEDGDGDGERTNELDPIMLVKVGKDCHRFVRPNGRVVMYNLDSLVDYFISTGDFLEPETRLPFSDEELRVIDAKVKAAGLSKPSVLEAKKNPGQYTEQKFQQDALVGLERMISELVTGMLKVVEESDREEGEIRLVTELFPPFADLFKQIRTADRRFAAQCMQHYTSWLQGPPNRPTEDEMGFLDIILGFLKQLQECEGNSAMGF